MSNLDTQGLSTSAFQWIRQLPLLADQPFHVLDIKTDASLRIYKRILSNTGRSFIFCQAESQEPFEQLLVLHDLMLKYSIRVPKIFSHARPYLLIEDLGDIHLKSFLQDQKVPDPETGQQLIKYLLNIQKIPTAGLDIFPSYFNLLRERELKDFLALPAVANQEHEIWSWVQSLVQPLISLKAVVIHHDFHWENLMVSQNHVYVLDYHEPFLGPPTYDVASLIADRGFYLWNPRTSTELVLEFCRQAAVRITPERVWETVLVRLLKIIGNFNRLGKNVHSRYFDYLRMSLQTLKQIPWKDLLPKAVPGIKHILDQLYRTS
jgi:aminoglycoside/choline kinase family phosphotransferase